MSRASVLARGRAAALKGMTDACVIEQPTGFADNDDTGVSTPTYTTVYTGPCRVQIGATSPSANRTQSGAESVVVFGTTLQLPVTTSTGVDRGHRVTITAALNDPDLVGRKFFVEDLFSKTDSTSRRLGLIVAT